ncbi:hypothetical protein MRX96_058594 [Rhipicephalus microplus]
MLLRRRYSQVARKLGVKWEISRPSASPPPDLFCLRHPRSNFNKDKVLVAASEMTQTLTGGCGVHFIIIKSYAPAQQKQRRTPKHHFHPDNGGPLNSSRENWHAAGSVRVM